MFCTNCGQQIDNESKVCRHCGQAVEGATETAATPVVEEPVQAPVEESIQAPVEESVQAPVEEPVQAPVEEPVQAPVEEPVQTPVEEPVQTPVQEPVMNSFNNSVPPMAQAPKQGGGNKVAMGIMAAIAIVAVVAVVWLCTSVLGKNEKTPLNNVEKIFNKKVTDIDKIVESTTPKFLSTAYVDFMDVLRGNDTYQDYIDDIYEEGEGALEDAWDDLYDSAEDEFGKNVKFSYKIEDKEAVDKDDLKDVVEVYQEFGQYKEQLVEAVELIGEYTDLEKKEVKEIVKIVENLSDEFEKMKISKAYILEVEVTVEGKDDDDSETYDIVVAKMNGSWTIEPLMTALINMDMDIDEVGDLYDDYLADGLEEFEDNFDDTLEMLEEVLEEMDDDILEMFLDEMLSRM